MSIVTKQIAMNAKENHRILIIEDEDYFRRFLVKLLSPYAKVIEANSKEQATKELKKDSFDAVIIDIDLQGKPSGFDILKMAKSLDIYSIMLTDNDSDEYIRKAYSLGCDQYLSKNQSEHVLDLLIRERLSVANQILSKYFFTSEYITYDQSLISEITSLKSRLSSDRSLLLLGPTGVGKTKLAEHIHKMMGGKKDNFISLNIAALPSDLIERELFGYQRGAFIGARSDKKGLMEMAQEGTLFLDEITSLPQALQKKLLKCLEEKIFYPLGAAKPKQIQFRLITSTGEDIYGLIESREFRADLFFRIAGIIVNIPALSKRKGDIVPLIKHFINQGVCQITISEKAMELLVNYSWPGNVRELQSVIQDLVSTVKCEATPRDLPHHIRLNSPPISKIEGEKFVSQVHLKFIGDYGYPKFIRKFEAEVGVALAKKFAGRSAEGAEYCKISKNYYYKIINWGKDMDRHIFSKNKLEV
ncbi:MAG: sigma-54-dependent Fis family transcriptional regulator [Oligoflexia bacterium]|nr:sigma-54-dependent Fis family transcriptional regulator [Oligoflexia bacterium]